MTNLEKQAIGFVQELVPSFSKVELRASISDTSHSIEFFVWINAERKQCYELADDETIDEENMERLFDVYAEYVRNSDLYKKGEVNKIHFTVEIQE